MEEGLGLLAQDEFHQGAWNRIEMGNLIHASFQRAPHQEGRGNISEWHLQLAQWHHHHAPPPTHSRAFCIWRLLQLVRLLWVSAGSPPTTPQLEWLQGLPWSEVVACAPAPQNLDRVPSGARKDALVKGLFPLLCLCLSPGFQKNST